jgi:hypothetical protein
LARWEREEAAAAAILAARAAASAPAPDFVVPPVIAFRRSADFPRVEHDGDWHTLH